MQGYLAIRNARLSGPCVLGAGARFVRLGRRSRCTAARLQSYHHHALSWPQRWACRGPLGRLPEEVPPGQTPQATCTRRRRAGLACGRHALLFGRIIDGHHDDTNSQAPMSGNWQPSCCCCALMGPEAACPASAALCPVWPIVGSWGVCCQSVI